jgi:large subunit ribosomal protein L21
MFAIIEESGRQIRVSEGAIVKVDYRDGAEPGQSFNFERVLLANGGGSSVIGKPAIDNATIAVEVVSPVEKGEKLYIQKFRRRKTYRKRTGHRQKYTTVKVTGINVPGLEIVEAKKGE